MPRTILLDLNYTLVENSDERKRYLRNYADWLNVETYKPWLVEGCVAWQAQGHKVLLVTARPQKWERTTLGNLAHLGFFPDRSFFLPPDCYEPPHKYKSAILAELLLQNPNTHNYIGLESNRATRRVYRRHGIRCTPVPQNGPCDTNPDKQFDLWREQSGE